MAKSANKKSSRGSVVSDDREFEADEAALRRAAKEMTVDEFASPTPLWYRVIMFALVVLGILWIMTFYITESRYPVGPIGMWNIGIGVGMMMLGMIMMTRWKQVSGLASHLENFDSSASGSEQDDGTQGTSAAASDSGLEQESKPEVTNPKNLAPVDPNEPRAEREDIKAAIFETKLRRWALIGFIVAAIIYFVWQSFF